MKKSLSIFMLIAGILLFALAFYFYNQAEDKKRDIERMRALTNPVYSEPVQDPYETENMEDPVEAAEPEIEPYLGSGACAVHWGLQIRQYCQAGDAAILDIVEGDTQTDAMESLSMCLNETLHNMDAHGTDFRPMDSEIPLDETNRKTLACDFVNMYGDKPKFDKTSLYSLFEAHVETGGADYMDAP